MERVRSWGVLARPGRHRQGSSCPNMRGMKRQNQRAGGSNAVLAPSRRRRQGSTCRHTRGLTQAWLASKWLAPTWRRSIIIIAILIILIRAIIIIGTLRIPTATSVGDDVRIPIGRRRAIRRNIEPTVNGYIHTICCIVLNYSMLSILADSCMSHFRTTPDHHVEQLELCFQIRIGCFRETQSGFPI